MGNKKLMSWLNSFRCVVCALYAECGSLGDVVSVHSVVQAMLRTHPYTTWPLHVKLFTREAVESWVSALAALGSDPGAPKKRGSKSKKLTTIPSAAELTGGLPPGMVVSVELEGVDGLGRDDALNEQTKRNGPIEVTDGTYMLSA